MSGKAMAATIAALAFGCLLAIGVLFATGAQAQEGAQCGPHDLIAKGLKDQYKEVPVARGLINPTLMTEKYASVAGTWTDVLTDNKGRSCIVAAGDSFEFDTSAFDEAKKGEAM